jgi:hypothetical protein
MGKSAERSANRNKLELIAQVGNWLGNSTQHVRKTVVLIQGIKSELHELKENNARYLVEQEMSDRPTPLEDSIRLLAAGTERLSQWNLAASKRREIVRNQQFNGDSFYPALN